MYFVIRDYQVDPSSVAEIARRVEEGFVPIVRAVRGFVSYSLVDFGGGNLGSGSIFADKAAADESVTRAADWVRQNLSALLPNPPEVHFADVRFRDVTAGQRPTYAVGRSYQADPANVEEIVRLVREGLLPILQGVPGYASYTALDFGNGAIGSSSTFADQAAAEESTRRAREWMQSNLAALLPQPPHVESGRILVRRTTD